MEKEVLLVCVFRWNVSFSFQMECEFQFSDGVWVSVFRWSVSFSFQMNCEFQFSDGVWVSVFRWSVSLSFQMKCEFQFSDGVFRKTKTSISYASRRKCIHFILNFVSEHARSRASSWVLARFSQTSRPQETGPNRVQLGIWTFLMSIGFLNRISFTMSWSSATSFKQLSGRDDSIYVNHRNPIGGIFAQLLKSYFIT